MKEKKIVLIVLAISMLIIIGANSVLATNTPIVIQTNNSTQDTNNVANSIPNNVTNNIGNNSANNTANIVSGTNNSSIYNNTNTNNLPKTGANDYAIIAIIVICIISAIYAYKKIRDYKV